MHAKKSYTKKHQTYRFDINIESDKNRKSLNERKKEIHKTQKLHSAMWIKRSRELNFDVKYSQVLNKKINLSMEKLI